MVVFIIFSGSWLVSASWTYWCISFVPWSINRRMLHRLPAERYCEQWYWVCLYWDILENYVIWLGTSFSLYHSNVNRKKFGSSLVQLIQYIAFLMRCFSCVCVLVFLCGQKLIGDLSCSVFVMYLTVYIFPSFYLFRGCFARYEN